MEGGRVIHVQAGKAVHQVWSYRLEKLQQGAQLINTHINSHFFDPLDPISIIWYLCSVLLTCVADGIYEGATTLLLNFFMKKSTTTALIALFTARCKAQTKMSSAGKTTTMTTYPRVVHYLLCTYATDKNVLDIKDEITKLTQAHNKMPLKYAKDLIAKALRCGNDYEARDLNDVFINVLDKSIWRSMRAYWASRRSASLHNFAFRAT